MKTLTLSLLATFCTLFSFAQSQNNTTTVTVPQHQSQLFLSSDRAQLASIENTTYLNNYYRENASDRCAKAKKMRTAGIVLASVGGGLLVGGITLIVVGVNVETNSINNGDGLGGLPFIAGGAVCTVLGAVGTGIGIPFAIIGSVKAKKYCGQARESSYMQLSTKGTGLALSF